MGTSLAELNDRVYTQLGPAVEFCDLNHIHTAVVQKHSLRTAQSQASGVNVLLAVSAQFTPTETTHDITALIAKGVPAWIEHLSEDEVWRPMRIVGLNQLSDYAALGTLAATFYSEDSADSSTEPVQYVAFTFLPGGPCRIRFDRDVVRLGMDHNILLPDNVAELITKEAQNTMIPRIKLAIDMRTRNDEELRRFARDAKQSLSEIHAQNERDIKPLHELWKIWAFRDRRSESSFNKPTPSGRNMYPTGIEQY